MTIIVSNIILNHFITIINLSMLPNTCCLLINCLIPLLKIHKWDKSNNLDKNCCHNAASANLPVRKFDLIPCGVLTNETGDKNKLVVCYPFFKIENLSPVLFIYCFQHKNLQFFRKISFLIPPFIP